jgi:predicted CXXCH cytochrome family protein
VRRLMLLLAVGTFWLFLAAIPAFADGGPHVQSNNSGMTGLTADGCAGCHRAHTATGDTYLLKAPEEALCQSCHGFTALGATTNVWNGVQYQMGATASVRDQSVILGALRNGGFYTAAIGTDSAAHLAYGTDAASAHFRPKVPVAAGLVGKPVTSAHLAVSGAPQSLPLTHYVWGNGTTGVGATTATLECTSCHNPHGNGNYRILVPIPTVSGSGNFVAPTTAALVTDAALPGANDTRNYTVIQTVSGSGAAGASTWTTTSLTVNQITASNVSGDYMHRYVPWNATASGTYTLDGPNGLSGSFDTQITAWCAQCHTQYPSVNSSDVGTSPFMYRHSTNSARGLSCVTCHVGHGSNAAMTGDYSSTFPYPGAAAPASASSRLLKVDNRGTCQACHDPTHTSVPGTYYPAAPVPLVP